MKDLWESSHKNPKEYCPSQIRLWAGHSLRIIGGDCENIESCKYNIWSTLFVFFMCVVFVLAFNTEMNCYV